MERHGVVSFLDELPLLYLGMARPCTDGASLPAGAMRIGHVIR